MRITSGIIQAVHQLSGGERAARFMTAQPLKIKPGQYLQADQRTDPHTSSSQFLFPVGLSAGQAGPLFGPIPANWGPGLQIQLRGPLGRGFQLPDSALRLGLVALGESALRLLPLIPESLRVGSDLVLFSASADPELPSAVEIQPLAALPEDLAWADLLLVDLPAAELPKLRQHLGLAAHAAPPCRIQVLLQIPMPCGGLGECGACAVNARRGYLLACLDGPVFDIHDLEW